MTTDLVSDMLTRIRNASLAKHSFTTVQYSKQNLAILKVLMSEGFINSYSLEQENNNTQSLKVSLKYKGWWIKKPLFSKFLEKYFFQCFIITKLIIYQNKIEKYFFENNDFLILP